MFGFEGWLLKVNGTEFPTSLIQYNSYKSTPDQQTDQDDYTDGDGVFRRNILPAKATKIEFNTKPLFLPDKVKIQQLIPIRVELVLEYWNDEINAYATGRFYVPDITYQMHQIYRGTGNILYEPIRIAFIEYGEVR